jgi:hypothetical protein
MFKKEVSGKKDEFGWGLKPLLFSVAAKYQQERFYASLQHLPSNF